MTAKFLVSKDEVIKIISDRWTPLSESQRKLLADNVRIVSFKKNDIIYRDGEPPREVMCLIAGKVKVYKDGVNGRSQIIRAIKAVDFFGYRAFFAGEEYKTSAMAIDNCVVAFLPIQLVIKFVHENNAVSMFFIRHLAKLLGTADERTVSLTQKHIRGRLAETLLFLKDSYGVEEDGYTLSIYLSREDIASMSNMTTSNAIRTLSSFAVENMIAIDGRKIRIMQDEELRKVSKLG
ncbi:MAG: Crp/Fnr family transcriptional regulator [Prevotella shahii]|jgi:transcriptional regulator, Crp/Fnr famil|uniref:CRP-like cAMP-binding protein n=1 Tax=Hoylesella shahii DSM 15611 = JCM 12083 TaxID=1122991 RepID=A0A318HR55_9BACT|nr:Crp/Fnr family transcriptional regulator [Hoylesella shahii]MBF1568363.1 Crp/Fnr family transcriptional regulator [Hoylesella shahii]PXX20975.1 CRP-like cAMP-binding protein [Hoylesella shahii DSM 15611 = JCM 12083]